MKNLILNLGRFFIDFGSSIQLLLVLILAIVAGVAIGEVSDGVAAGFLAGILTFFVLFTIFVLSNYILYSFIGMCDSLKSISESLSIMANSTEKTTTVAKSTENKVAVKCPNCGTNCSSVDSFCENCGTKLN